MEVILDSAESTVQNFKYASVGRRFVAVLIDSILLSIVQVIFGVAIGESATAQGFSPVTSLIGLIIGFLYEALMISSDKKATIGKIAMGIQVTDPNGEKITFANATGRYFAKFLSAIILLIGYIMAFFNEKKLTLHDKLANTIVIKR